MTRRRNKDARNKNRVYYVCPMCYIEFTKRKYVLNHLPKCPKRTKEEAIKVEPKREGEDSGRPVEKLSAEEQANMMMSQIEQSLLLQIKRKLRSAAVLADIDGIKVNEFLYAAKVKLFNVVRQLDFGDIFASELSAMREELDEEINRMAKDWEFSFWGECSNCKHMLETGTCIKGGTKHECCRCKVCNGTV